MNKYLEIGDYIYFMEGNFVRFGFHKNENLEKLRYNFRDNSFILKLIDSYE